MPEEPAAAADASGVPESGQEASSADPGRSPDPPPQASLRRGVRTPIYSSFSRQSARTKGLSWHQQFADGVPELAYCAIPLCGNDLSTIRSVSQTGQSSPPEDMPSTVFGAPALARSCFNETGNFARPRVPSKLRLLIHRLAVDDDFKSPFPGRNHQVLGVGPFPLELSRQTDGSGLVVSKRAVFDRDLHGISFHLDVTQVDSVVIITERCR